MIHKIQIDFPCEVDFPDGFERELDALINKVCKKYEKENPTRTMWPSGQGSMPVGNWMLGGPDPVDFDDTIYYIEVAERDR